MLDSSNSNETINNLQEIILNNKEKLFYIEFINKIENEKNININASVYYEKKSMFLTIPSITITSIAGMASFLSAASFFNEDTKLAFSLGVGILGSISSLIQTFDSAFKFNTKAEMFRTAAEQYDKLITQTKFELTKPNDPNFIDKLEKKMLEIQNNCKYFPPQKIINSYNSTNNPNNIYNDNQNGELAL
tara:strand:+ start:2759 stop:3328 length:570 start_codon:yes stop_codon:yes gene_type:complete